LDAALAFGSLAFVKPAGLIAVADAEQRGDTEDALEPAVVAPRPAEITADLSGVAWNGCDAAVPGEDMTAHGVRSLARKVMALNGKLAETDKLIEGRFAATAMQR
jgi:hypothetical protein